MNVNYTKLVESVRGTSVSKPLSGTLSGHAAGEPFDKHVYSEIKKQLPENTFRQYEYLNDLYSKNAEIIGVKAYLKHFVAQVYRRSEYMIQQYAKPFEKYII